VLTTAKTTTWDDDNLISCYETHFAYTFDLYIVAYDIFVALHKLYGSQSLLHFRYRTFCVTQESSNVLINNI